MVIIFSCKFLAFLFVFEAAMTSVVKMYLNDMGIRQVKVHSNFIVAALAFRCLHVHAVTYVRI